MCLHCSSENYFLKIIIYKYYEYNYFYQYKKKLVYTFLTAPTGKQHPFLAVLWRKVFYPTFHVAYCLSPSFFLLGERWRQSDWCAHMYSVPYMELQLSNATLPSLSASTEIRGPDRFCDYETAEFCRSPKQSVFKASVFSSAGATRRTVNNKHRHTHTRT